MTLSLAVAVCPHLRGPDSPGSPPDRQSCRRWAGGPPDVRAVAAVLLPLTTLSPLQ
ncbi:hypothetical protein I553_5880 [Mycobacterium xenopi 4042]|uniref:Uncharacterized protein n=1 Tax=Mycobacterium xenopi 4042 TaxID=1299334 RepID=X7ZVQ5_MYCXE|nr:hypothetical protein I553_5880 [Mycobacterium xenopi 4042]